MPNLEICSRDKSIYWRVPLTPKPMRLGRMQSLVDIVTPPSDNYISKCHATLTLEGARLHVARHAQANNPIYRLEPGKAAAASDEFTLEPGDSFQIGSTIFRLCPDEEAPQTTAEMARPSEPAETSLSPEKLREFRFVDANHRVEALADLPQLILSAQHERMLDQQVLDTLLKGLPEADVVAVVKLDPESSEADPKVQVLALKSREQMAQRAGEHRPSRKLVFKAVRYLWPTHHVWQAGGGDLNFTTDASMDWALCVPMPDEIAPDQGIYAAGHLRWAATNEGAPRERAVQGDLKFAQLTANIYASLLKVLELQNQQRALSRFLPMPIVAQMSRTDAGIDEFLQARECDITVLFCDLRGSCKIAESGTDLKTLLGRLTEALGIMTDNIVQRWGVIGDFQGDAAMAFWGWPKGERQVERAAEAALHIQKRFRELSAKSDHLLAGMACGIGLAHGRGLAGRLGTPDQYKVGAFGPVVNLAARLESLTKHMGVSILADGAVAAQLGGDLTWVRRRRVARLQPAGMDTPVEAVELLPPEAEPGAMTETTRRRYEGALDAFYAGRWKEAENLLSRVGDTDGPARWLRKYIADNPAGPPGGWNGTIVLSSK
jgi:adenylate cyclase